MKCSITNALSISTYYFPALSYPLSKVLWKHWWKAPENSMVAKCVSWISVQIGEKQWKASKLKLCRNCFVTLVTNFDSDQQDPESRPSGW